MPMNQFSCIITRGFEILFSILFGDNITWHQVQTQQHFSPSLIFCNNIMMITLTPPWCLTLTAPRSQGSEHRDLGRNTLWPELRVLDTRMAGSTPQMTSENNTVLIRILTFAHENIVHLRHSSLVSRSICQWSDEKNLCILCFTL